MQIRILPGTVSNTPGHPLTSIVINGTLAIDAGSLGFCGTVAEQASIRDILLTHAHIDHIAGLPVFLDNVYGLQPGCPTIHALQSTLEILHADLFNDRLMPDFFKLSKSMAPFVDEQVLVTDRTYSIANLQITAVPVDHTIPTIGFVVDDGKTTIAMLTDTRPVPQLIERLTNWPRLRAVFLECSFPNRLQALAETSKHLTTREFGEIVSRLPKSIDVHAIHIKPHYYDDVIEELKQRNLENVVITSSNTILTYE